MIRNYDFWLVDGSYLELMKPSTVELEQFSMLTYQAFNHFCNKKDDSMGQTFLAGTIGDGELTIFWKLKQPQGFQIILGSCKLQEKQQPNHLEPLLNVFKELGNVKEDRKVLQDQVNTLKESNGALTEEIARLEAGRLEWEEKVFVRVLSSLLNHNGVINYCSLRMF